VPPFQRHVFVCTNERAEGDPRGCCAAKHSGAIRDAMKSAVKRAGLEGKVRVNVAGCLDQCEHGVTIVVYPEVVWYGFVTMDDVAEIVDSHLIHGQPVERLRLPDLCINTPSCRHRGGGVQLGGLSKS
jgi:(2Fe-2S) ferredoxin